MSRNLLSSILYDCVHASVAPALSSILLVNRWCRTAFSAGCIWTIVSGVSGELCWNSTTAESFWHCETQQGFGNTLFKCFISSQTEHTCVMGPSLSHRVQHVGCPKVCPRAPVTLSIQYWLLYADDAAHLSRGVTLTNVKDSENTPGSESSSQETISSPWLWDRRNPSCLVQKRRWKTQIVWKWHVASHIWV